MAWKTVLLLALALAGAAVVAASWGSSRWNAGTRALITRLHDASDRPEAAAFDPEGLSGLPEPVRRYLRTVIPPGRTPIRAVAIEHTGTFDLATGDPRWLPFTSRQRVVTGRPGFVWDARIRMAPGVRVFVHDAYVGGEGVLEAKVLGLVTVARATSTPELAQGELTRYLAETPWYPTALLPGHGVAWVAIDERRAAATLTDGDVSVRMNFTFDDEGLVESVRSEDRYRDDDGALVPTPWEGRFWDYAERDGLLVPLEGEVAWLLPDGPRPYWRGRIEEIAYE
jgi:hypothetical protein